MAAGNTERTLKWLRKLGATADVTERWIPGANIRKDLFGFIDVLALLDGKTVGVQCTSYPNIGARITKIETECREEALAWVKAGNLIEVWGWKKEGNKWIPTIRRVPKWRLLHPMDF